MNFLMYHVGSSRERVDRRKVRGGARIDALCFANGRGGLTLVRISAHGSLGGQGIGVREGGGGGGRMGVDNLGLPRSGARHLSAGDHGRPMFIGDVLVIFG